MKAQARNRQDTVAVAEGGGKVLEAPFLLSLCLQERIELGTAHTKEKDRVQVRGPLFGVLCFLTPLIYGLRPSRRLVLSTPLGSLGFTQLVLGTQPSRTMV